MSSPNLLFLGTPDDKPHLHHLKAMVGASAVFVALEPISTIIEVVMYCRKRAITGVISTNVQLLKKLLEREHEVGNPSLDNYEGSWFKHSDIEFVFIKRLELINMVPYQRFITKRWISKLAFPQDWPAAPQFRWTLLDTTNVDAHYQSFSNAIAIATDIETFPNPPSIRCIGFTAVFSDLTTTSVVLPLDSLWALAWMRKFCDLEVPKIFQRGNYDCAYLARYNSSPWGYLWDTATMFYCWYSELPKDLAFITSFFVRESLYWKDLAETNDLKEYYRYNALDTWGTACAFIQWMVQAPDWAKRNYEMCHPLVFPNHMCEMTGVKRDKKKLLEVRAEVDVQIEAHNNSVRRMIGQPAFNSNSHVQVKKLMCILGCADIADSSNEKNLNAAIYRHPLNARILNEILEIRGLRKLASTYLCTEQDIEFKKDGTRKGDKGPKEFLSSTRILYALFANATDSGRLASRESHFWCGLQIQNIPVGKEVKSTIIPDAGFRFGECDLEQAESRDTAYISGDPKMIAAVESTNDFHSTNASMFFGIPYAEIFDNAKRKVIKKIIRQLSKKTNHGANYNMGPTVLVATMGYKLIYEAQALLKLPKLWSANKIAEYLLECFHKVYTHIRGTYYPAVVKSVLTTQLLIGATGWTRYCFGRPDKNKADMNAYAAHNPQSLNAMKLNIGYMKVFYEIALNPEHASNFKLNAQIHDSIFFQFREGHEYLATMVKERMEIPLTITSHTGVSYTYTVPAAIKAGPDGKGALRWSETE